MQKYLEEAKRIVGMLNSQIKESKQFNDKLFLECLAEEIKENMIMFKDGEEVYALFTMNENGGLDFTGFVDFRNDESTLTFIQLENVDSEVLKEQKMEELLDLDIKAKKLELLTKLTNKDK